MKLSITYLYTIFRYGYPHGLEETLRSLGEIRRLGFRYLEMEGLGRRHLRAVYRGRKRVVEALKECGVHVHNFCVVDPDLVSLNEGKRKQAFDRFEMGAELAEELGAETLHLASYAPPVRYLNRRPYELGRKGGYRFADHTAIRIPDGFDWNRVWEALVESCRHCAEVAARGNRTVIMEPRVGEAICSVDSMLRLIEHVNRGNFKANFDTAHFSAQRENVALALTKLRGHFANVHIADNIPVNTEHLPIGEGQIDWKEFLRVLNGMGYRGYLGLDLGMRKGLIRAYRSSVERLRAIADELGIAIEV